MTYLHYLSDHLKITRRRLDDCRHGGLVLTGDQLDSFIGRFDSFIEMARLLENALSREMWNGRAAIERAARAECNAIAAAEAARKDSNVVIFPGRIASGLPEPDGAA